MEHRIGMILFSDKVHKVVCTEKVKKHILSMISQLLSAQHHLKSDIDGVSYTTQ